MGLKRGMRLCAVVVAGLALSVAFSGCFLWSSFKWSKPVVKEGKRVTATIGLQSDRGPSRDKMVQFFLIGVPEQDILVPAGTRKWDIKGKFGGPETLFSDGTMANAAINADSCMIGNSKPNEIMDYHWHALRTDDEVDDRNKEGTLLLSKVGMKAQGTVSAPSPLTVYVFSGVWHDTTEDGQPQDDEIGCSGGTITNMTIK